MNTISRQQQKEFARTLYLRENLTQAEIAERVGVSRQTVIRWVGAEKWDELKASISMTAEEQIRNLQRQVIEINNSILNRESGNRYANAKEADTIVKLTTAINKLQTEAGIHEIVGVGAAFVDFMRPIDLEKAQEFTRLFDAFIKAKMTKR
ncbi:DUF1804 family protein [Alistipes putredinis]|jgi:uncharacterized protein YjcR|uniref:DUF1804 family protein n=1 Tax=Alistipes putredinis TaxID=28117 RepID=UPI0020531C92|nr:DUF1804 family protein [Alistipes putredinis]MBS6650636.1 DUF1804 family protein [Alistipes putredinis]DAP85919.1 MAG TPA: Protein of unknown function (DUF1804) [Caudoviricetes sp.]